MSLRFLLAGRDGQLGRALIATAPDWADLVAPAEDEFDISNPAHVAHFAAAYRGPTGIINAAAYTAVDRAESDEATARRINADGVRQLASAFDERAYELPFVHISTDFVFDGTASTPYPPDARPNPCSVYGQTKWEGEQAALAHHHMALVIRTAWVYAAKGNNFVNTMLRLMRERDEVRVVADQIGTPTHATSLARAIWTLVGADHLEERATGLHHFTDAGTASWYDFAVAIQEEALAQGLLSRAVPILPIRTADYPTPARRPAYGVLDKTATWALTGVPRHWREELRRCLKDMHP